MKIDFEITGCFYRLKNLNCRKHLDIKRRGYESEIPDLLVVMMNPGSSKPVDGKYCIEHESKTAPDRTQQQIMRVMERCEINHCRIINLTDIQETRSDKLYLMLAQPNVKRLPHSIFDPRRKRDLELLVPGNVKVLFAWGVHDALGELAQKAFIQFGNRKVFGLKKKGESFAYYHALPPNFYKQKDWVNQISQQILNT